MRRRFVIGGLLGAWLLVLPFMLRRADASCMAPTQCTVETAEVRSCAVLDVAKRASLMRYLAELRKEKQSERARQLEQQYRGVMVEVQERKRQTFACRIGLSKDRYDESGYAIGRGALVPTEAEKAGIHEYFFPTKDADACSKRFAVGRTLRIEAAATCCDGDPGVPCLLHGD